MANEYWDGGNGSWSNSAQWTPSAAPQAGDTAYISSGTVEISGLTIQSVTIDLEGSPYYTADLQLLSSTLDSGSVLNESTAGADLFFYGTDANYGSINVSGYLYFDAANGGSGTTGETFTNFGTITVTGGASVNAYQGNTFDNEGVIAASYGGFSDAVAGGSFINNGTISFLGSTDFPTNFAGNVSGSGSFTVGQGASVEFDASVSATQSIEFLSGGGTLKLNGDLLDGNFSAKITGFAPGDTIDLGTGAPNSVVFANGVATLELDGTEVATLDLNGGFVSSDFYLVPNGGNDEFLETRDPACFAAGTRITTPQGEVAVQNLRIGDLVTTATGAARPIHWLGRRAYGGRFVLGNRHVLPIRIRENALGDRVPRRDLFLSPNHAMYIDGVLIPAIALVNGTSIVQLDHVEKVEYFHVELGTHDVILAEGAPVETFVDDNSRGIFHNAAEYTTIHPSASRVPACYCAPRIEDGEELEFLRRRLATRVTAEHRSLGWAPEEDGRKRFAV